MGPGNYYHQGHRNNPYSTDSPSRPYSPQAQPIHQAQHSSYAAQSNIHATAHGHSAPANNQQYTSYGTPSWHTQSAIRADGSQEATGTLTALGAAANTNHLYQGQSNLTYQPPNSNTYSSSAPQTTSATETQQNTYLTQQYQLAQNTARPGHHTETYQKPSSQITHQNRHLNSYSHLAQNQSQIARSISPTQIQASRQLQSLLRGNSVDVSREERRNSLAQQHHQSQPMTVDPARVYDPRAENQRKEAQRKEARDKELREQGGARENQLRARGGQRETGPRRD